MRNLHLIFLISLFIPACSSLDWAQRQITFQAEDGEAFLAAGQMFGISIKEEDYFLAKAKWPFAKGEHLRRRALILALDPSNRQIEILNLTRSEKVELEMINALLSQLKNSRKLTQN